MSVTIILVFGERVSKLIPELTLLQWFHYPRVGVSSEGIAVVLCASVCENVFCSGCCYFFSAYSRGSRPSQLLQKVVFSR